MSMISRPMEQIHQRSAEPKQPSPSPSASRGRSEGQTSWDGVELPADALNQTLDDIISHVSEAKTGKGQPRPLAEPLSKARPAQKTERLQYTGPPPRPLAEPRLGKSTDDYKGKKGGKGKGKMGKVILNHPAVAQSKANLAARHWENEMRRQVPDERRSAKGLTVAVAADPPRVRSPYVQIIQAPSVVKPPPPQLVTRATADANRQAMQAPSVVKPPPPHLVTRATAEANRQMTTSGTTQRYALCQESGVAPADRRPGGLAVTGKGVDFCRSQSSLFHPVSKAVSPRVGEKGKPRLGGNRSDTAAGKGGVSAKGGKNSGKPAASVVDLTTRLSGDGGHSPKRAPRVGFAPQPKSRGQTRPDVPSARSRRGREISSSMNAVSASEVSSAPYTESSVATVVNRVRPGRGTHCSSPYSGNRPSQAALIMEWGRPYNDCRGPSAPANPTHSSSARKQNRRGDRPCGSMENPDGAAVALAERRMASPQELRGLRDRCDTAKTEGVSGYMSARERKRKAHWNKVQALADERRGKVPRVAKTEQAAQDREAQSRAAKRLNDALLELSEAQKDVANAARRQKRSGPKQDKRQ